MLISTRGEYGLRAMMVLAEEFSAGPVPLRQIAQKEHLSEQYLEHLFRDLRTKELVTSFRGAKGGYKLSRPPSDITVGDVLWALEGSLAPMQCVAVDEEAVCRHRDGCSTRFVWQKLKVAMDEVLDTTTLADILARASKE
ncbi:MAG: Rrf2 family transcriptional regulator [Eubacteriales bacterium]|nr:Rrf2 family transcriptional regulator [Eubacteriales bacterium]MDD3073957.1 Rrf2 family transcriptional regulator [Eubacteriales bacterium]MDD4079403.1 Rrf2 family transcriptional regulator [Eubacteriales bacterium]MDD4769832.1 Rrf2 family transcriptional regulator [Eubacteriales bacterium]